MLQLGPEIFDLLNTKQEAIKNQRLVVYGKGGLSVSEVTNIENQLEFKMPEDFVYLLQNLQDTDGVLFPWKKFSKQEYDKKIERVLEGIVFDIERNNFWLEKRWGSRPEIQLERVAIVKKDFSTWPKLLPIFAHRFLAAEPCLSNNPVFSIMQTDIIYYGANLAHYLIQEFVDKNNYALHTYDQKIRKIDVWGDMTS